MVKLGTVSLDGTKMKANASLSANRTLKHLEQEIDKMLSEAEAKDAEEDKVYGADRRGDELPEDLRDRNSRINRLSSTELMERKLLTERGRELYKIRGQTVEPVFGQIKDVRGFDRFMQRGIDACRGEWSLICATHNLLKLWRSGKACWN